MVQLRVTNEELYRAKCMHFAEIKFILNSSYKAMASHSILYIFPVDIYIIYIFIYFFIYKIRKLGSLLQIMLLFFSQSIYLFLFIIYVLGTNWIWEIVSMVVKEKAEYERNSKLVSMLEMRYG